MAPTRTVRARRSSPQSSSRSESPSTSHKPAAINQHEEEEDEDGEPQTAEEKKHASLLARKARNRAAAQASRDRKAAEFEALKDENEYLKNKLKSIELDNNQLKHQQRPRQNNHLSNKASPDPSPSGASGSSQSTSKAASDEIARLKTQLSDALSEVRRLKVDLADMRRAGAKAGLRFDLADDVEEDDEVQLPATSSGRKRRATAKALGVAATVGSKVVSAKRAKREELQPSEDEQEQDQHESFANGAVKGGRVIAAVHRQHKSPDPED
ncbi:hypothetical protein T439DRAFT_325379 [Meredithblackwellia eburnea MCA 4105]